MAKKHQNQQSELIRESVNTLNAIAGDVTDAIMRNDYSHLSGSIKDRVAQLTDEVKAEAEKSIRNSARTVTAYPQDESGRRYGSNTGYAVKSALRTPFLQKRVSKVPHVVKTTVGASGTGIAGMIFLAFLFNALLLPGNAAIFIAGAVISGVATAVFGGVLHNGINNLAMIRKYLQMGQIAGAREYVPLTEFSEELGKSTKAVYRDLLRLKAEGFLPQAKFDEQQTTLMLTKTAYDQYLVSEESRRQRELEAAEEEKRAKESPQEKKQQDDVQALLDEGNAYLMTIRSCNDDIPGREMSDKLDRLESIMRRIFDQVRKDPSCAGELRKFMSYYLPTTVKLLRAYIDLDKQPDVDNVRKTRQEIEDSLDTINIAFEKLLDSLFQDMAWDISSDISVMKTMLAQDGLTDDQSGFRK